MTRGSIALRFGALAAALAVHAAIVAALSHDDRLELESQAGAADTRLGASFADMVAGATPSPEVRAHAEASERPDVTEPEPAAARAEPLNADLADPAESSPPDPAASALRPAVRAAEAAPPARRLDAEAPPSDVEPTTGAAISPAAPPPAPTPPVRSVSSATAAATAMPPTADTPATPPRADPNTVPRAAEVVDAIPSAATFPALVAAAEPEAEALVVDPSVSVEPSMSAATAVAPSVTAAEGASPASTIEPAHVAPTTSAEVEKLERPTLPSIVSGRTIAAAAQPTAAEPQRTVSADVSVERAARTTPSDRVEAEPDASPNAPLSGPRPLARDLARTSDSPRRETAEPRRQAATPARQAPAGNASETRRQGSAAVAETAPSRRAGQQGTTGREAGATDVSNYPGLVYREISRVRTRRTRETGTAIVAFSVTSGGGLGDASLVRSSGSPRLDREAMRVVKSAAPFPAPPPGAQRSFRVPITFD